MSRLLEEKVEELAMMVVMIEPGDEPGLQLLFDLVLDVNAAADIAAHTKFLEMTQGVLELRSHDDDTVRYMAIQTLLSNCQTLLNRAEGDGNSKDLEALSEDSIGFSQYVVQAPNALHSNLEMHKASDFQTPKILPSNLSANNEYQTETCSIFEDPEIFIEFLAEAEQHLEMVEALLLEKESGYSGDDLDFIFRAVHSVKGGSSYFNLSEVTKTSHAVESLMDLARNDRLNFNAALKAIVLKYIDVQRILLTSAKSVSSDDQHVTANCVATSFLNLINDYMLSADMLKEALEVRSSEAEATTASRRKNEGANENADPFDVKQANEVAAVKNFVKIDAARLDLLVTSIAEMVESSSMLIQNCRDLLADNEVVAQNSAQLERITHQIQDIGVSMQLVPLKGLFQKMARVVWDAGRRLSKDVGFEAIGENIELDRIIVDALADPLLHMVRNAVDHGLESPEERASGGKSPKGTVQISAYEATDHLYVEVTDDGRGLDKDALISEAVKKGILQEGQPVSEDEVFMLIFSSGFSTATQVTKFSGRGVGMDVVRQNIERMGGRISIESEKGKGTTIAIELPFARSL